jgi:hypothetical protein
MDEKVASFINNLALRPNIVQEVTIFCMTQRGLMDETFTDVTGLMRVVVVVRRLHVVNGSGRTTPTAKTLMSVIQILLMRVAHNEKSTAMSHLVISEPGACYDHIMYHALCIPSFCNVVKNTV